MGWDSMKQISMADFLTVSVLLYREGFCDPAKERPARATGGSDILCFVSFSFEGERGRRRVRCAPPSMAFRDLHISALVWIGASFALHFFAHVDMFHFALLLVECEFGFFMGRGAAVVLRLGFSRLPLDGLD